MRILVVALVFVLSLQGAKTLDFYFVDVEGGQATLIVSPSGQSLLIDGGFPGFSGRDAGRIVAAAKHAKVKKIDTMLITHHHNDHVGGAAPLAERIPVSLFIDHGPSIETPGKYPEPYAAAFAKTKHRVVKPGEKIDMKGIDIEVLTANGEITSRAGQPNPACPGIERKADDKTENPMSVGVVLTFGKFRFIDLGDLTWNKELELSCPVNRTGTADVYLVTHHGSQESPRSILNAISPRVAIINNGSKKGGAPAAWKAVKDTAGLEDIWQLHFAVAGGKETNAPDSFIANVDEPCEGAYIKLSANSDGSFTVFNSRNKHTKTYAARR
jgi:beta-lactamase superfamily II metal-dependent hydrolase